MSKNARRTALFLLVFTLLSFVLLSSGLSNLQLHAGSPFPGAAPGAEEPAAAPAAPAVIQPLPVLNGFFALLFLVILFFVLARLIVLANPRRILRWIPALAILFLVIVLLPRMTPAPSPSPSAEDSGAATRPSFEYLTSPLGKPPEGFVWVVAGGLLFGAGLLVILMSRQPSPPAGAEDRLLAEAENAVHALHAGRSFRDVITRCYMQMSAVLQEERGLERSEQMTVREFEDLLKLRGMPPEPVHQLTALFEKVRYGREQPEKGDEERGVECLNEIIQFCRRGSP